MANSVESIGEPFFYLRLNFVEMFNRCETDEERSDFEKQFRASRRNFNKAINLTFSENAAAVKSLKDALKENTQAIKAKHESAKKMAEILSVITEGVELGKSLVALGS